MVEVRGLISTKVQVDPLEVLSQIRDNKFGQGVTVVDGEIVKWVDVGYHKADYEKRVISRDSEKVKALEALNTLVDYLSKGDR